jgi:hypothetical protein
VETPLRPNYENFLDLSLSPFPISREGQHFNLLNVHYLNLNRLPGLKLPVKHEKLQWISWHLGLMYSDEEKIAREGYTTRSGIINQSQRKYCINLLQVGWGGEQF